MKNPFDVLRAKEKELVKVKREIEALRVALPLLREEEDTLRPPAVFGATPPSKGVPMA